MRQVEQSYAGLLESGARDGGPLSATTVGQVHRTAEGFSELLELIAAHGGTPETVPVAIETDKNLIVVALTAAGFTVYPINPRAATRYRERHRQAGGKSDAVDADSVGEHFAD